MDVMLKGESLANWYVYILKLEQNSWYVGTAKDLIARLETHAKKSPFSKIASNLKVSSSHKGLTGIRKAIEIRAAFSVTCNTSELTEIEDVITASLGNKYGYHLVRGGTWHQVWSASSSSQQAVEHSQVYRRDEIRLRYQLQELDLIHIEDELPFYISNSIKR